MNHYAQDGISRSTAAKLAKEFSYGFEIEFQIGERKRKERCYVHHVGTDEVAVEEVFTTVGDDSEAKSR
jgi:hypothetical protein